MKFEKLYIGQEHNFQRLISTEDVIAFANLSGDHNPVHLNEEVASKSIFKNRIIHGMIVGALFSKALATNLPGPGSIYINQSLDFKKPIYHNSVLNINITVTNLRPDKKLVFVSTTCSVNEEITVEGNALLKLFE